MPHTTAEKHKEGKALTTAGPEPRFHEVKEKRKPMTNELNGLGLGKAEG